MAGNTVTVDTEPTGSGPARGELRKAPDELSDAGMERSHTGPDMPIYEGDVLDGLRTLPDKCAQLVVADPPYNVGPAFGKRQGVERRCRLAGLVRRMAGRMPSRTQGRWQLVRIWEPQVHLLPAGVPA